MVACSEVPSLASGTKAGSLVVLEGGIKARAALQPTELRLPSHSRVLVIREGMEQAAV